MEELCPCPRSGLHPLRPRRRVSLRPSPRDRSAMSTRTPSPSAGLLQPRIRTLLVGNFIKWQPAARQSQVQYLIGRQTFIFFVFVLFPSTLFKFLWCCLPLQTAQERQGLCPDPVPWQRAWKRTGAPVSRPSFPTLQVTAARCSASRRETSSPC